jgi:hypothetical protein
MIADPLLLSAYFNRGDVFVFTLIYLDRRITLFNRHCRDAHLRAPSYLLRISIVTQNRQFPWQGSMYDSLNSWSLGGFADVYFDGRNFALLVDFKQAF